MSERKWFVAPTAFAGSGGGAASIGAFFRSYHAASLLDIYGCISAIVLVVISTPIDFTIRNCTSTSWA